MNEDLKQIDRQRRIMIPKEILEDAGLNTGEFVSVSYDAEQHVIVLKPMRVIPITKQ